MGVTPTILVFDLGTGRASTVFREVAKARPDARYVYVADDAFFPYGEHAEEDLVARVCALMAQLVIHDRPDLVVIVCNTASTLVLPHLRARLVTPSRRWSLQSSPPAPVRSANASRYWAPRATVSREYTRALIRDFSNGSDVALVGSSKLAEFAEKELQGRPVDDAPIVEEIAPCFITAGGRRTDTIVLACTHYPLLLPRFERLSPWPVT